MKPQKKPAAFLKGIDRIIFDMDGVITSEENYWNAAALTVYEMLNSKKYNGDQEIESALSSEEIKQIREEVFAKDELISLLKDRGVNTNWDLAYIVLCTALLLSSENNDVNGQRSTADCQLKITPHPPLSTPPYKAIYRYLSLRELQGTEIYRFLMYKLSLLTGMDEEYFQRHGELWEQCRQVFQEWYLGEKAYVKAYDQRPNQSGKKGLMFSEQSIIPLHELTEVLEVLRGAGISLGIGTGRPFVEIQVPLVSWGIEKYFDRQSYITYTEVIEAEAALTDQGTQSAGSVQSLAKPHPYVFLKAIYGKDYDDQRVLNQDYDKSEIEKTLIIGDAGSDIMAAQAIGCKFAAVLTGVSGEKARGYFEQMGADYILESIRDLIEN